MSGLKALLEPGWLDPLEGAGSFLSENCPMSCIFCRQVQRVGGPLPVVPFSLLHKMKGMLVGVVVHINDGN